jgi:hypothetical protein
VKNFYGPDEISPLGQFLADCYFRTIGKVLFPIDPEVVATKFFGLDIMPKPQLMTVGVKSGIDTTQSVIFIDENIYMDDSKRHLSNQSIAHELGHAIFDVAHIRQMAGASLEDVYERHQALMSKLPGIESRANMLSGSFLVPRHYLIKQIALRLVQNYDQVTSLNPYMPMHQVLDSMASSQLGRYFGQSDYVLDWRIKNEDIYAVLGIRSDTPISAINIKRIAKLVGLEYKATPLNERIKGLLPEGLMHQHDLVFKLA